MHKMMEMMQELTSLEEKYTCWLKEESCKEKKEFDLECAGEVADMIKDLAEAKEKCAKAKYYEAIVKEMEEYKENPNMYGYDNWRYSSGRFAPTGKGHYDAGGRSGYNIMDDRVRIHDPNIVNPQMWDYSTDNMMPMGYSADKGQNQNIYSGDGRSSRRGSNYDDYVNARRHYHETKSTSDNMMMNEKIENHAMDSIMSIKEMWQDASPDVRKKIKTSLTSLIGEIKD